jgi:hypothetical protein
MRTALMHVLLSKASLCSRGVLRLAIGARWAAVPGPQRVCVGGPRPGSGLNAGRRSSTGSSAGVLPPARDRRRGGPAAREDVRPHREVERLAAIVPTHPPRSIAHRARSKTRRPTYPGARIGATNSSRRLPSTAPTIRSFAPTGRRQNGAARDPPPRHRPRARPARVGPGFRPAESRIAVPPRATTRTPSAQRSVLNRGVGSSAGSGHQRDADPVCRLATR